MIEWILILILFLGVWIRVRRRGYFWKDKEGKEISFKEFMKRWKGGVADSTALQQTRISMWSMFPIFAGIIWGMAVTFLGKTWWLTLILAGSLPITSIQFIQQYQKYKRLKQIDIEMTEAMNKK